MIRLFFLHNIDTILSKLLKLIKALEAEEKKQSEKTASKTEMSYKLQAEANAHNEEAKRAKRVADNLRKLVD